MKIDRRRPSHWLLLLAFFIAAMAGAALRCIPRKPSGRRRVLLYGHKLNGNLLALHRQLSRHAAFEPPVFFTMDRHYLRALRAQGVVAAWACGWRGVMALASASALVSDHGLHALQPWLPVYQRLGLRFFDVWHGIPFKGFDADDFRLQHRYDETWVASDLCKALYVDRFGFAPGRVIATGYARTDQLVSPGADISALRSHLGLPADGKVVLFAPTWAQDAKGRSLYPFGIAEAEFLGALSALAGRHGATVVLRSHLNSGVLAGSAHANIVALPASRNPDAEAILLASDVLVCDWSSIAFDFLLLDRPAFFLDVPPPFRKGFSLGPEYRFGNVVGSLGELLQGLDDCLQGPSQYWAVHRDRHDEVRRSVYGDMADGHATQRCLQRLLAG